MIFAQYLNSNSTTFFLEVFSVGQQGAVNSRRDGVSVIHYVCLWCFIRLFRSIYFAKKKEKKKGRYTERAIVGPDDDQKLENYVAPLDLVVAELVHHLVRRLRVPAKVTTCTVVDVRATLRSSSVSVRWLRLASVTRGTSRFGGRVLQHAILRLRYAPVHRL